MTISYSLNESKQSKHRSRRLEQDLLLMGALVEQSFRLAHSSLFQREIAAAEQISQIDLKIDRFYHEIEVECAELMAIASPAAQDLRRLSAFMQMVRDLERIGDYAKDISEISLKLFPYSAHPCLPAIEQMSHHARAMLEASLAALSNLDGTAGPTIHKLDDEVDRAYDEIYQTLATQGNLQGSVEPTILLALTIRHLERMADHATNIAYRVTFIVTGSRQME
ncbi:phosphate signaling complex protein PhoU [Chamaesiphon minutus]|uniref:Phosphate-specific transport system accessory protein PhoU n=1 Tax=Chamaesiphon minutus (strain ATCC 27169 / PCC 6605) TaxID=1173020 RepID=K9UNJ6_CHAP6|nr:phosphate signaling complex protein PhoU [Chamaesiphon minutus]AFY96248.1 phosphate transport system regulatory protein PhoU [Chamaesiphon minutus PCC 6605]